MDLRLVVPHLDPALLEPFLWFVIGFATGSAVGVLLAATTPHPRRKDDPS